MNEDDKVTAEQMVAARKVMDRYELVFSVLAQGDASPFMTDALRERLTAAEKNIERYKTAAPHKPAE